MTKLIKMLGLNLKYWYKYRSKKKKSKDDFEKDFCNLMNNTVFEKSVENIEILNLSQQKEEETI